MHHGPLDFAPLWVQFALTFVLVLFAIEGGFEIGVRRAAQRKAENASSAGAMANASLALLAFLLAFTFGFAASRLEARRTILLDEVNAIGTTYLRAGTLPDAEAAQARVWLREYVDSRLEAVRTGKLEEGIQQWEELQRRLWESAAAIARSNPTSIPVGLYLQTLNAMIDLHATRLNESVRVRIPVTIWAALYVLTVIAMLEMGYQTGLSGKRRPLSVPAFALAFAVVIYLIGDLDRPQAGTIRVSQQPLVELRQSMNETPP